MPQTFKRLTSRNVGTTAVQIGGYTTGSGVAATVFGLTICNTSGNDIVVTLYHYDGTNQTRIVVNALVKPGGTLVPVGWAQRVALQAGDSMWVVSGAASSVDVIMSVLELS